MKKLLLVGGGGHCRSVMDSVINMQKYDAIGIVDKDISIEYRGIKVVGRDEDLPRLFKEGWTEAFVSVGSIGATGIRVGIYNKLRQIGFDIPVIVDPSAIVAGDVFIGQGSFVGKRAVINSASTIGDCAIINTAAVIEHDCTIGPFTHVAPGAVLCGGVTVGGHCHIGAGTVIRQQLEIGENTLIGAGSVVLKNISGNTKAYGSPCREVE